MKLIKVFQSISINEAHFVKSLLEAQDIPSEIFDEAIGSLAPHYLFHQGGVRLMVRHEDAANATEIIQDYLETVKENTNKLP